ncbi:hypothetical protein ACIBO5_48905 [Nonomuraea angiospora]|uniref:hypothetical protein n=1 Tax=Nonomuraea angiospora TaxID=46172 RepID=UPI0029B69C00|nr:hypothetical protein [Nonomuraea angiospora]MDX3101911.1 hypothetical protein [Nonomuraea angiospora]
MSTTTCSTIESNNGTTLAGPELSFRVDDFVFPIAAQIHDRTATLTPLSDLAHAVYRPVDLPYQNTAPWKTTPYDRELATWARMTSTISVGAPIAIASAVQYFITINAPFPASAK